MYLHTNCKKIIIKGWCEKKKNLSVYNEQDVKQTKPIVVLVFNPNLESVFDQMDLPLSH